MFINMVPDPSQTYPIPGVTRLVYLKNIIKNPQICVGDYTYYDDPEDVYNFERNVLYLFDFVGDRLIIGRFCQIASGVRFIMNGGNHAVDGFSTYPFKIFGGSWCDATLNAVNKGNTVVGHDVWFGHNVTIMPGLTIGHGAIIATSSVVTKDVPPYTIVGGNPAREIRKRFAPEATELLLALAWWDWPVAEVASHLDLLTRGNLEGLRQLLGRSKQ
jgi:virginiamycin A acetyltransferase